MAFMIPMMVGSAATAATATAAATAATTGLIGAGGAVTAGGLVSAASTLMGLGGAMMQGRAAKDAAKAEQAQLDYAAGQAEASSQREAIEERRKADLLISRGIAVGAASGAGMSGISGILEGIAGRGEEAAGAARYEGTEKAKEMRYRGAVGVSTARQQARATTMAAVGKAGGSIYERFAA